MDPIRPRRGFTVLTPELWVTSAKVRLQWCHVIHAVPVIPDKLTVTLR